VTPTRAPVVAQRSEPTPTRAVAGAASASDRTEYWVQVGAFRDADVAKQVAAKLRERDFRVVESTITRNGSVARRAVTTGERYEVVVAGSKDDLAARLAPRGLSVDPMKDGVRVRPMLPLRDAVALSKDLAGAGFKVQVKRATAEAAVAPRAPEVADGVTWYRVRVGPFPERASAQETLQKLTDRGYTPYIAHGQD
jgi:cell division protein FtsN